MLIKSPDMPIFHPLLYRCCNFKSTHTNIATNIGAIYIYTTYLTNNTIKKPVSRTTIATCIYIYDLGSNFPSYGWDYTDTTYIWLSHCSYYTQGYLTQLYGPQMCCFYLYRVWIPGGRWPLTQYNTVPDEKLWLRGAIDQRLENIAPTLDLI